MSASIVLDGVTATLTQVWAEVTTCITTMKNEPLIALAISIPVAGGIVGISKRLFRRK